MFSPLLKLKDEEPFDWKPIHHQAFKANNEYLVKPPVLMPLKDDKPINLYISATDTSIGVLLAQDNDEKKEHAIFFLP